MMMLSRPEGWVNKIASNLHVWFAPQAVTLVASHVSLPPEPPITFAAYES